MMSTRRFGISLVLPLAALLGAVGCQGAPGSSTSSEPVASGEQALAQPAKATGNAAAQTPAARELGDGPMARHGRPMGPPAPEHLLFAALRELDLTPAQKSAIQAALPPRPERPDHGPARAAFAALAAGVRAGSVDPAAVVATVDGADGGFAEHQAAAATALDTLHAALTKEQRRTLVDAMEKRMAEHGPMAEHAGPPPGTRAGRSHRGGPMGELLAGLDVSDAQRASIEKALEAERPAPPDADAMKKRAEAMRGELRARLESFVDDAFDAKAFVSPPAGGLGHGGPKQHLERMAKDVAIVVPLLEPAQREALAVKLEKGPPMGHGGPMGGPPPDLDEPAPEGATR
jgi:Spy/CpxP family protein refolding chaperone